MRWSIAYAIFRKEILETLRDRRTLVVMLLLPLLLYPVMMVVMMQLFTHQMSSIEKQTGIVLIKGDLPPELEVMLNEVSGIEVRRTNGGPLLTRDLTIVEPDPAAEDNPYQLRTLAPDAELHEWSRRQLQDGFGHLVLVVPAGLQPALAKGHSAGVMLFYDETNHLSRVTEQRVTQILARWERSIRKERDAQVSEGYTDPIVPWSVNTANAEERGGFMAGQVLPVMLMMMVMLGAFYPAIDLTAGEKERGTMQTLMTAPAQALEIIVGKFLTVVIVALISAVANLLSMGLAFMWILGATGEGGSQMALNIELSTAVIALAQLLPIAVFFSAMMLAIAVFAQSFKEAQNYLSPAYIVIILPAFLGAMPGVELTQLTAMVPGLNFVLLIRGLLTEGVPTDMIGMVLLANFIYAALAIAVAVRIFQNEEVLLGGTSDFRDIFRATSQGQYSATPVLSLTAFAVGMLLFLYLGQWFQRQDMVAGMIVTQWALLALPVIIWLKAFKLDLTDTLQLRAPSALAIAGAVCIGISAWASIAPLTQWIQSQFITMPPELAEQMQEQLGLGEGDVKLPLMLFAFAISPAICEELFFRGLIFGGLRKHLRPWTAILITGLLFGLLHVSIYRIVPTGVLGAVLALVALRSRSIWPAIIIHALHNGTILVASTYNWFGVADADVDPNAPPNILLLVGASVLFIIGLVLILKQPQPKPAADFDEPEPLDTSPAEHAKIS